MSTIPASELVQVIPSVLGAGGRGLDVIGLVLTSSARVPIGTVQAFPDAGAVGDYFGDASSQKDFADKYFAGFDNSSQKPGRVLFAQYNQDDVAAYLRGGNISDLPLATLQSYNAPISVTIDGDEKTATVNLAGATSFSNAAALIAAALDIEGIEAANVTGSIGGTFACTSLGTTLTVVSVITGSLQKGDGVSGTDTTNTLPGGCTILRQLSGDAGGIGTYELSAAAAPGNLTSCTVTSASSKLKVTAVADGELGVGDVIVGSGIADNIYIASQESSSETDGALGKKGIYVLGGGSPDTVASEAIQVFSPGVYYDPIAGAFVIASGTDGVASTIGFASGALATLLLLTAVTGAVISPGADAATPGPFMDGIIEITQNWVTFATDFDPDAGSGHANKELFAEWKDEQNNRYCYVCWDTDAAPSTQNPAVSSLGQALKDIEDSGTALVWNTVDLAAFVMGAAASINFTEQNGRITFAYKAQAGLAVTVSDRTKANNLLGNGYNFYGPYGAANDDFIWFQNGQITGDYRWIDSYIYQIWFDNACQLAVLGLLGAARSIPYTASGNGLIEAALNDPIQAALNFGMFAPGTISASQIAQVNQQAGGNVSDALQAQGYYVQILPATSEVRANRQSPPIKIWYLDRGSVQHVIINSIAVQ